MSDKAIKTAVIKSKVQIMHDAVEEVKRTNSKPKPGSPLSEVFTEYLSVYGRLDRENEARKSPEQRDREAREQSAQWAQDRVERARKKAEKKSQFLMSLYGKYLPFDAWKIMGEAVPLLCGEDPESFIFTSPEYRQIKVSAERAVLAKTLRVLNPSASSDQWLVIPVEFHAWAIAKKFPIPREFEVAFGLVKAAQKQVSGVMAAVQGPTGAAIEAKTRSKAKRRARVKEFRAWIDAHALACGYLWSHSNIPDTKQSAHRVFFGLYPEIVKVAPATLADDLHEAGIRFDNSGKSMKNNVLEHLFKQSKKTN